MTWPPTLYDETDLFRACKVRPESPDLPTAQVEAPCCGRTTAADAVRDLRGVPGAVCCPGGGGSEPEDLDFACDGCYWRIIASSGNPWTESQMVRALGGPREVQVEKRAEEEMRRVRRESAGPYRPREIREQAKRDLDTPGPIEGTDPPVSR